MVPTDLCKAGFKAAAVLWLLSILAFFSPFHDSIAKGAALENAPDKPAFSEEQVNFTDGQVILEGTLFRPATGTDYPAVVILAGSDRSKRGPLRINLARQFAAHKIAALVYDSPGAGISMGRALIQTREDRVKEAISAVDYLRELRGIRSTSVGLFGGSEGAGVALLASAKTSQVAFVIAVSGALGVSILDVLRYSAEKKGYMLGLTYDEITKAITFKEISFVFFSGVELVEWPLIEARTSQWNNDMWTTLIELAKRRTDYLPREQKHTMLESLRQIINRFKRQRWFNVVDPGGTIQHFINLDSDRFFKLLEAGRYSRDWDRNVCDLSTIRCPVLAIWGEEDSFLPPQQSALRLRKALSESHHPDYEIKIFPEATHFLTKPGSAAGFIPGYIDTMTVWLNRHIGSDNSAAPY